MRGRQRDARGRSARITSSRRSMTRRPGARCFRRTIRQCEKHDRGPPSQGETAVTRLSDLPPAQAKRLAEVECPKFATTPFVSGAQLSQRKIAIVSSAGLFRRDTEPFRGRDSDYRVVRGDIAWEDLLTSHISVNFDRTGLQEDEGLATVSISLIRPQTENTRPPRALWAALRPSHRSSVPAKRLADGPEIARADGRSGVAAGFP